MMTEPSKTLHTRRSTIKSLAALATIQILPSHIALGGPKAPSNQLTKGIVGCGGISRTHLRMPGKLLALCDVDSKRLKIRKDEAKELGDADVTCYSDFRELITRKDIDIVHVATPPHWHALIAIAAAKAGKDIWCEKPMSRTIGEGLAMIDAVEREKRIFRINTWFRFRGGFYGLGTTVKPLKKIVDSGVLGWPLKFTVSGITGYDWKFYWSGDKNLTPEPVPEHLDYNMWLGPAPVKPYNPLRVHSKFRGFWDYDGGGLGDMGQHYLDPVQYMLSKDHTSPIKVEVDAPQQHFDAVGSWRRITYTYEDGCQIILDGENKDKDAAYIEGPNGKIYRGFRSTIPNIQQLAASLPDPEPQITSFHESVRTRQKFALNEMNGHRSAIIVNMGVIALRLGRTLHFDPVKQEFINDEGANRLISPEMRSPWSI